MGWEAWVTVVVLGAVLGLMAGLRLSPDIALCGGLTVLLTLGIVTPAEALSGLANEGADKWNKALFELELQEHSPLDGFRVGWLC
jgi:hypothetical protein